MNRTHFHRFKDGAKFGSYEWATTAHLDAIDRGGTVAPCNCDDGADEIARRNEKHGLALTTERTEGHAS